MQGLRSFLSLLLVFAFGVAGCGGNGTGDGDGGPIPSRLERYIRSDTDTRLVLEVDYVEGFEPYAATGPDITAGLEDLLDKPDGVELVMDETIEGKGSQAWTREELFALADDTMNLEVTEGSVKIHVLFVDGHDQQDDDSGRILGLAWDHRHLVIYKQTLEDSCSGAFPFGQQLCENAEVSILTHELGHVIGLVDNGLPMVMDHKDEEHGAHDISDECVMYWAYEGDAVIDSLANRLMGGNTEALGFDPACQEDIAAVRDAM